MIRFLDLSVMFYDIHTHKKRDLNENVISIYNLNVPDYICCCGLDLQTTYYSLGIHPWKIKETELSKQIDFIEKNSIFDCIKAIGECGLDKLYDTPWKLQESAFISQLLLSEKWKKPLIIHCVKSVDELIGLRKEMQAQQAWIIHGFRGKPEQAQQLINQGCYLSFGVHFNVETLQKISMKRIFFETDDAVLPIEEIYKNAALAMEISENKLILQIEKNYKTLF